MGEREDEYGDTAFEIPTDEEGGVEEYRFCSEGVKHKKDEGDKIQHRPEGKLVEDAQPLHIHTLGKKLVLTSSRKPLLGREVTVWTVFIFLTHYICVYSPFFFFFDVANSKSFLSSDIAICSYLF